MCALLCRQSSKPLGNQLLRGAGCWKRRGRKEGAQKHPGWLHRGSSARRLHGLLLASCWPCPVMVAECVEHLLLLGDCCCCCCS
jgi:hypothetical protein